MAGAGQTRRQRDSLVSLHRGFHLLNQIFASSPYTFQYCPIFLQVTNDPMGARGVLRDDLQCGSTLVFEGHDSLGFLGSEIMFGNASVAATLEIVMTPSRKPPCALK